MCSRSKHVNYSQTLASKRYTRLLEFLLSYAFWVRACAPTCTCVRTHQLQTSHPTLLLKLLSYLSEQLSFHVITLSHDLFILALADVCLRARSYFRSLARRDRCLPCQKQTLRHAETPRAAPTYCTFANGLIIL